MTETKAEKAFFVKVSENKQKFKLKLFADSKKKFHKLKNVLWFQFIVMTFTCVCYNIMV